MEVKGYLQKFAKSLLRVVLFFVMLVILLACWINFKDYLAQKRANSFCE